MFQKQTPPSKPPEINFFNQLTFSWISEFIMEGYKNPIKEEQIFEKEKNNEFSEEIERYLKYEKRKNGEYPFWNLLIYTFGNEILMCGIYLFITLLCNFSLPILLNLLMDYLYDKNENSISKGVTLVFFFGFLPILKTIFYNQYYIKIQRISLNLEGVLQTIIFRKYLSISSLSHSEIENGEIVNLLIIDSQKVSKICSWIHFTRNGSITLFIGIIMLYYHLGYSAIIGGIVIISLLPLSIYFSNNLGNSDTLILELSDQRMKILNELFHNIKFVKLSLLEKIFIEKIEKIRKDENLELNNQGMVDLIQSLFSKIIPLTAGIITFIVYILSGNEITSTKVFVTISIFNIIENPLILSSNCFYECLASYISGNRIKKFLNLENDLDLLKREKQLLDKISVYSFPSPNVFIQIINGKFQWEKDKINLENINLSFNNLNLKGKLIGIYGETASGKSSLLNAIAGNITMISGNKSIHGKISFCPQIPWMINGSIKQNILFGLPFNKERYDNVIKVCQLEKDLKSMDLGDETYIESSLNLSSGQKSRISLARACYSESDIVLLDSTLSCLDNEVSKKIFDRCLKGYLTGRIIFFVTHSIQHLSKCDTIINMKQGKIFKMGSFEEFQDIDPRFQKYSEDEKLEDVTTPSLYIPIKTKKKLEIPQDEKEFQGISWKTYLTYFRGFKFYFFLILFVAILSRSSEIGSGLWLSFWNENYFKLTTFQSTFIYIMLGLNVILQTGLLEYFFLQGGLKSSMELHTKMILSLLNAPLTWFDQIPIGNILMRCSEDIYKIDTHLYHLFQNFSEYSITTISILIFIIWVIPIILIFLIPLGIIYYFILKYFRKSFIRLKRLIEKIRSPISTLLIGTIFGSHSIRAYEVENIFINEMDQRIEKYQRSKWVEIIMYRWLSIRLEILSVFIVVLTSILGILTKKTINTSLIGLAVVYCLNIGESFNKTIRSFIQCESCLIHVERIMDYFFLQKEENLEIRKNFKTPKEWPNAGEIKIEHIFMKYKKELDTVLNDISCIIKPGQTIGIVGRSGSGKSSLMMALFRIVELSSGRIQIDSIDISKISLFDLRSKISIIPQEPIIFSGTLRSNLDPFGEYSDFEIWNALEAVFLKEKVENMLSKLDEEIFDSGSSLFSTGEKQLLCLSKALLKKTRIVIFDENTSNLDLNSENLIQKSIRDTFKNQTVIAIAHRINTVIDADMMMVLEAGKIVEFDSPHSLLQNEKSMFFSLVEKTGKQTLQKMKQSALLSEEIRKNKMKNQTEYLIQRIENLEKEVQELKKLK